MKTLSLCMIVKNEEQNLRRCLNSVKDHVNEIVIVDTGSTDSTIEIAKEYTSNIFNYIWDDDFSKPRNLALRKATSSWILVLDADECISAIDLLKIRNIIESNQYDAIQLIKRSYCNNPEIGNFKLNDHEYKEAEGFIGWQVEPNDLVFKNDSQIYYEDCIHETIRRSLFRFNLRIAETQIPVHHYGRHDMSKKADYYGRMVRKQYQLNPKDHHSAWNLGAHLDWTGDLEEALEIFRKCEQLAPANVRDWYAISLILIKLKRYEEAKSYLLRIVENSPEEYDIVWRNLMVCFYEEKNLIGLFNTYNKAIKYNPKNILINIFLAQIYLINDYVYIARNIIVELLKEFPNCVQAKELYDIITKKNTFK